MPHGMSFYRDQPHPANMRNDPLPHHEILSPPLAHGGAAVGGGGGGGAHNVAPLSFEQAVAMGRGGRMLPSPVPNGYKPKPTSRSRHSDSDDDDWC